jgi:hypothetical protein
MVVRLFRAVTFSKLEDKPMAHKHVNEYQIRIAQENGTEELTIWMSEEQLVQAMARMRRAQGQAYWLRVREVLCTDCVDHQPQIIAECPITDAPSPRSRPHSSRYLVAGRGTETNYLG